METLDRVRTHRPSADSELRDDGAYVFHHPPKFLWGPVEVPPRAWTDYTLYLHVPFCRAICTFCTFERSVYDRAALDANFEAVLQEVARRRAVDDFSRARAEAIYLGGGTASLLSVDQIVRFLGELRTGYGWRDEVECTLECEPGTKRLDDFRALRDAGINRISIGAQSFSNRLLKQLNRRHTADTTRRTVEAAQQAGFDNIHLDLMYGLPGQELDDWTAALDEVVRLGAAHVSTYRLIVFADELLSRKLAQGETVPLPAREAIEEMRLAAREMLPAAGLPQYSLTEFAPPERRCRYVQSNWDGSDYLGFGVAAYSRNDRWLWENTVFQSAYLTAARDGRLPVGRGLQMDAEQRLARDLAMGLCLFSVDLARLHEPVAGLDPNVRARLDRLQADELVRVDGNVVALSDKGVRYATHVMKQFAF